VIYWDHNASSPVHPEVARKLAERLSRGPFGNASSVHSQGRASRGLLDDARARVSRIIGCEPKEVCFTASGSEADALAVKGAFAARTEVKRKRLVTSTIEHPALLGAVAELERQGAEIVRVAPTAQGRVAFEALDSALTPDTALCSLMWANNETGVLQPVREVAALCKARGILFHSDAVQVAGKLPVSLQEVDASMLSLSAHKFGGPQGVGAAIIRRGVGIAPLVPGHQELGRRGGTPSPALASAFADALELSTEAMRERSNRLAELRLRFERDVRSVWDVIIQGEGLERIANTSNIQFTGVDGEALLIALDLAGICVSSGAACSSGTSKPSHVLLAMGLTPSQAQACLRFSFGPETTDAEVSEVLEALSTHLPKSRAD
jgi:cysteine desulfurase